MFELSVELTGEWWFVESVVDVLCDGLPVGLSVDGLVVVWIARTTLLEVVDQVGQFVVMAAGDCCWLEQFQADCLC